MCEYPIFYISVHIGHILIFYGLMHLSDVNLQVKVNQAWTLVCINMKLVTSLRFWSGAFSCVWMEVNGAESAVWPWLNALWKEKKQQQSTYTRCLSAQFETQLKSVLPWQVKLVLFISFPLKLLYGLTILRSLFAACLSRSARSSHFSLGYVILTNGLYCLLLFVFKVASL